MSRSTTCWRSGIPSATTGQPARSITRCGRVARLQTPSFTNGLSGKQTDVASIDVAALYAIADSLPDAQLGYFDYTFSDEKQPLGERIATIANVARVDGNNIGDVLTFWRDEKVTNPGCGICALKHVLGRVQSRLANVSPWWLRWRGAGLCRPADEQEGVHLPADRQQRHH